MSLGIAARIARREMRGGLRGFRVFLLCLALGVAAIAAVGSVRSAIEAGLSGEGARLLGGDAEIELTYRFASEKEREWMQAHAQMLSEVAEFRSMLTSAEQGSSEARALTKVKAVDGAYPLVGKAGLEPDMPLARALAGQGGVPGIVVEPLLADRLGVRVGAHLRLGDQEFILTALLQQEPDNASAGFSLGPRSIVRSEALEAAGLLQPGTLFETRYRLLVPPGQDLDVLRVAAKEALGEGAFRWRDRRKAAPGVENFVKHLSTFLVLVGLAGLAVGGVGVSAAVRAYLDEKVEVIATLRTLGARRGTILQVYLMQIGVLAALGILLGLALGALVPVLAGPLLQARLPVPARFAVYPGPLFQAAVYGFFTAALFSLWPIARTEKIRPAALFRDAQLGVRGWPRARFMIVSFAILVALVWVAGRFSGELLLAFWMAVGLVAAFAMLSLCGIVTIRFARWLARLAPVRRRPALRLALVAVGGPGAEVMSVILSLGLGLSVLASVGQIDTNLRRAIAGNLPKVAPMFFGIDIQQDQIGAYKREVLAQEGAERVLAAPMLRGVIARINGRPATEVAPDHWVVRGDRGITFSAGVPEGTRITAGKWWPEDYTGPPQISFAEQEAGELGLKLGDTLTLNILGRDITGAITSFRDVNFSSVGMDFVVLINPSAVAGAPHSYISTIYGKPAAEAPVMRALARDFPNVTVISVRSAIAQVAALLAGVSSAITAGALATLATGAVVLIGAAAAGERARAYEAAILKTLGAERRLVLLSFLLRSAVLGAAAGLVATAVGAIAGWGVITKVMSLPFAFSASSALMIVSGGILAVLLAGAVFSLRALNVRPSAVLRARE